MEIVTKYNIGQKVWCVFLNAKNKELEVFTDVINEIVVNKEGKIDYFLKDLCDDIKEEDIIPYEEQKRLLEKIIELEKELDRGEV